jgi:hypothetical protein
MGRRKDGLAFRWDPIAAKAPDLMLVVTLGLLPAAMSHGTGSD